MLYTTDYIKRRSRRNENRCIPTQHEQYRSPKTLIYKYKTYRREIKCECTSQAKVTETDGSVKEHTLREPIDNATAAINQITWYRNKDKSQLLQPSLIDYLETNREGPDVKNFLREHILTVKITLLIQ